MNWRKIVIYVLVVVLIVVVGFEVYQKKFAHAASPAPKQNTTATTTSNTTGNGTGSNNTTTSNASDSNSTNSAGGGLASSPANNDPLPTAQEVKNMNVVVDLKDSQKYADQSGKTWVQVKEYKAGLLPNNRGTIFYVDLLFHNGSKNTVDINVASNTNPAFTMEVPTSIIPASMNPPTGTPTVDLSAGPKNGSEFHMPYTKDVKIAPGKTGEIQVPFGFPVPFKASDLKNQHIQAILQYGGTGMAVPLIDPSKVSSASSNSTGN